MINSRTRITEQRECIVVVVCKDSPFNLKHLQIAMSGVEVGGGFINLFMDLNNGFTVIIRLLLTTCHKKKNVCAHAGCEVLFLPPGAIRAPTRGPYCAPVVVVYSAADNYRYHHVNLRMLVSVTDVVVVVVGFYLNPRSSDLRSVGTTCWDVKGGGLPVGVHVDAQ